MRLLLDTHVFLWATLSPGRLSSAAREAIADRANDVYVSAAAVWEIVIKFPSGKMQLPMDPVNYVPSRMAAMGFTSLGITQEHVFAVSLLPPGHKDPFDRLMVAQAQVEGLLFVTCDATLLNYPLKTLQA